MIDLHSHILPQLDDGSQSLRESVEMARLAVESGVHTMVATPHCSQGGARQVMRALRLLQDALMEAGIPLTLYPGMEIFGTDQTLSLLKSGELLTLNGSRYPLVEFSFYSDGQEETHILSGLVKAGYKPLVAHPERYEYLQQDPELVNHWRRMGCRFQVNKGSLLGSFGTAAQAMAMALIDRGFATVVASDAHSARRRTPWMEEAAQLVAGEFGPAATDVLFLRNPRHIIKDEQLPPAQPAWF